MTAPPQSTAPDGERPSLRSFLAGCEADGDLVRVKESVDPRHVVAAVLAQLDGGPPVVFEDVTGSGFPVVGNVLATRARIARALGVPLADTQAAMTAALTAATPTRTVTDPECQQVVDDSPDLGSLPVPTFFEHESGPYVTAGVIVARDPDTRVANASFARLKVLGPRTAMVGIAPNHHLARMARARPDGRLDVAVVIGAHPAVQLAACLYLDLGDDELTHVAALLGQPLDVAAARTVDVDVPATAEFVLEGTIDVNRPIAEGPVSEFHGMYEDYGSGWAFDLRCVTSRRDPLFQVVLPGCHDEHILLGAVAIAAGLRRELARSVPTVTEVAVVEAGAGRLAAVVAVAPGRPGQARRVMTAVWTAVSLVKQVTVVDVEVDVWDAVAVERARITWCRAERDIVLLPGMSADRSEPLESGGTVTKVGYDATAVAADRAQGTTRAEPPAAAVRAATGIVGRLGRTAGHL